MPRKRSKTQTETSQDPKAEGRVGKSAKKSSEKKPKRYQQFIFRDWCKACGICAAFCPKGVIGWSENGPVIENPEKCIGCRFCELHCPDFAITIQEKTNAESEEST